MGFTDLLSDAGLTGESAPHAPLGMQRRRVRPHKANKQAVLNSWLTTRSYIVGYVCTPQDICLLPADILPHPPLPKPRCHPREHHDENHWSVLPMQPQDLRLTTQQATKLQL